nr:hypothetical protein Itr_chr15CG13020 [Ipomoea trifida]
MRELDATDYGPVTLTTAAELRLSIQCPDSCSDGEVESGHHAHDQYNVHITKQPGPPSSPVNLKLYVLEVMEIFITEFPEQLAVDA